MANPFRLELLDFAGQHRPVATKDPVRARLSSAAKRRGESLAALSRMIGRNPAYLQQFIARGSPQRLAETDRRHLAEYLGIDERELGARDPWSPRHAEMVPIRVIDLRNMKSDE